VLNGPIFPPGMKNDHVWAEIYFPGHGWMPVDVTYSEVASMVPGLSEAERPTIRDFFIQNAKEETQCNQTTQPWLRQAGAVPARAESSLA
jgi:transglutaminase-like putative cysteine protease